MIKVVTQISIPTKGLTLLGLDEDPKNCKDWIVIEGKAYKPEIVYDCPKAIAIHGLGEFVGKEIAEWI